MSRFRPSLATLALAAPLLTAPAGAQAPDPAVGSRAGTAPLVEIGGTAEERARLSSLLGAPAPGLLRSPSSTTTPAPAGTLRLLVPAAALTWNSRIPFGLNDGARWAGKGLSASVMAGAEARVGPLRLIVAPVVVHQQNLAFDSLTAWSLNDADRESRIPRWLSGEHAADLPFRLGDGAETALHAGESSLTVRAGWVEAGAATESQWWGPGVRNAIVLGNHAGGFPHLLLRTARPVATPVGRMEARWISGRLTSSPYDTAATGRRRTLSAAALTLDPGGGFTAGAARAVYAPEEGGGVLRDAPGVFLRWRGAGDTLARRPHHQLATVFARWVAPSEGVEVYAEWGRHALPTSARDFLEQPDHTQGYTLGAGWARPAAGGVARLRGEVTNLEKSATYRSRPTGSWYAGPAVPQGYTHRGQSLGAAIGPGASSQWFGAGWTGRRWQAGAGATRVRWANDAYYSLGSGARYRGHDVSVLGSLDAGVAVGGAWIEAEWSAGRRYNYLFQSRAGTWDQRDRTISPFNHTLRLRLSAAPPALRR